jgi:uncharacterized membrane protein
MGSDNLVLVVGTYDDAAAAADDYASLKSGEHDGEYKVVGAVVLNRDADGKVDVKEHDETVGEGAMVGAGAGIAIGLFAPPLLLLTAIGAGIGAGIGALRKRHEEKKLGVDVDEYLPPGSSAVVAIVEDEWADKVEKTLAKSDKRIRRAVDSGDIDAVEKAISRSADDVEDAGSS